MAGVLVLILVPIIGRIARFRRWVDAPSDERWHEEATPHLGGIALIAGVGVSVAVTGGMTAFSVFVWVGTGLLFGAGLADDLWGLTPAVKLGVQFAAALLVLRAGLFFWPGGNMWVAVPLTVLWVLVLTNAVNLLDAMDGVAAGVGAVGVTALGTIAILQGQGALAAVSASIGGAAAGFLAYNVAPARIFMGDSGSLPVGYLLAVLGLGVLRPGQGSASLALPILVLAVPLFDTSFVIVTRLWRGQPVSKGGVDHVAHRLVRLGWSERWAACSMWAAGAVAGTVGILGVTGPNDLFYLLAFVVAALALGVGGFLALRTEAGPKE